MLNLKYNDMYICLVVICVFRMRPASFSYPSVYLGTGVSWRYAISPSVRILNISYVALELCLYSLDILRGPRNYEFTFLLNLWTTGNYGGVTAIFENCSVKVDSKYVSSRNLRNVQQVISGKFTMICSFQT